MANKFTKALPNAVTSCNLLMGCVATLYAFQGQYTYAFLFILLGGVFDFFDGLTARALHVSSPIGKELDSLADDITFGLAPASMVYTLLSSCVASHPALTEGAPLVGRLLPYTAFLLAIFSALRLAKFNLDTRQSTSFIGLPTPANALFWGGLCVGDTLPLTTSVWGLWVLVALVVLFSWLLIAEIPMFSLKFKRGQKNTIALVFVTLAAGLLLVPLCLHGPALALTFFPAVIGLYLILSLLTRPH